MRPAAVTELAVKDGWAALAKLDDLIAKDDLTELGRAVGQRSMTPAEIHAFVRGRVRYVTGDIQRWATPKRTLRAGFGDCGNTTRLTIGLARLNGYPARRRVFLSWDKGPGMLARPKARPAHVVAEVGDGGVWRWAESAIAARYGESTLDAARRLGIRHKLALVPTKTSGRRFAPVSGRWPFAGLPRAVSLAGRSFSRAKAAWPFYRGVIGQYREDVPRGSLHLNVYRSGVWQIDHADAVNPDMGSHAEHFFKDVVRGLPSGTIAAVQVPATKTPVSPEAMAIALRAEWLSQLGYMPTGGQVLILLAQWGLETANGQSMIQWNVGNVKHVSGDGLDWTTYETTEGSGASAQTLEQSFKAYPDLASGVAAYFSLFTDGGRYANAWPSIISGDPDGFAAALKAKGYYTASEASYAAGLRARLAQFEAMDLDTALPLSQLPPLLAIVGVGVLTSAYAWSQGWLELDPGRLAAWLGV